tara:strand:+ start:2064 stop:2450 length:387 start_codon:yes stop_codon:yes gene_type:complete
MGLKSDIYKAFEKNLGEDFVNATKESKQKVDDLAEDLRNAIIDFIVKQDFNITEMEAPYNILPGKINTLVNGGVVAGPGAPVVAAAGVSTAPVTGVVQISETSNKVGLPTVNTNVRKSKVKLINVKEA